MAAYASCKMKEDEWTDLLPHPQKRGDEVCLHPRAMQKKKYINKDEKHMQHIAGQVINEQNQKRHLAIQ